MSNVMFTQHEYDTQRLVFVLYPVEQAARARGLVALEQHLQQLVQLSPTLQENLAGLARGGPLDEITLPEGLSEVLQPQVLAEALPANYGTHEELLARLSEPYSHTDSVAQSSTLRRPVLKARIRHRSATLTKEQPSESTTFASFKQFASQDNRGRGDTAGLAQQLCQSAWSFLGSHNDRVRRVEELLRPETLKHSLLDERCRPALAPSSTWTITLPTLRIISIV